MKITEFKKVIKNIINEIEPYHEKEKVRCTNCAFETITIPNENGIPCPHCEGNGDMFPIDNYGRKDNQVENQLKNLIKETIQEMQINEGFFDDLKQSGKAFGQMVSRSADNYKTGRYDKLEKFKGDLKQEMEDLYTKLLADENIKSAIDKYKKEEIPRVNINHSIDFALMNSQELKDQYKHIMKQRNMPDFHKGKFKVETVNALLKRA